MRGDRGGDTAVDCVLKAAYDYDDEGRFLPEGKQAGQGVWEVDRAFLGGHGVFGTRGS